MHRIPKFGSRLNSLVVYLRVMKTQLFANSRVGEGGLALLSPSLHITTSFKSQIGNVALTTKVVNIDIQ